MIKGILLIFLLLLIFSKWCLSDDNPPVKNFNDYINNSAESSMNKNMNPMLAAKPEVNNNSDQADTQPQAQGISDQWKTCLTDSDCTAVVADCVSWDVLNKKYLNRFARNLRSCSDAIDPGFQLATACVHKMCQTIDKVTDVSFDEWLSDMHKRKEQSPPIIPLHN